MARAGLTRDGVVDAAIALADEVGLDHLTLAALAERVGVKQPSLYKHIDSLAGLHRSIRLSAKRELGEVLVRAAVGRSHAAAIMAMAHAYRDWAVKHPARYQASQTVPAAGDVDDTAVSLQAIQIIADVLAGYALTGDDAIDAIRGLRATLHGFVSLETTGGFALKADVDRSFERLVHGFAVSLQRWTETSADTTDRVENSTA